MADAGRSAILALQRNYAADTHSALPAIVANGTTLHEVGPADAILLTSDGRNLYTVGAASGKILGYARDRASGRLTAVRLGDTADAIQDTASGAAAFKFAAFSPDGATLYVTGCWTETLSAYARDAASGRLTLIERDTPSSAPFRYPTGVTVAPDGRNVYLLTNGANNNGGVYAYERDRGSGTLQVATAFTRSADILPWLVEQYAIAAAPDGEKVYVLLQAWDSVVQLLRDGRDTPPQFADGPYRMTGAGLGAGILWANAVGGNVSYTWYCGTANDRSNPIGTFPLLALPTSASDGAYWVEARNDAGSTIAAVFDFAAATEPVIAPTAIQGPARCEVNQLQGFVATGSVSSLGGAVEYQFDWGDGGALSDWSAPPAAHGWPGAGTYLVKARARSVANPQNVSAWSAPFAVQAVVNTPPVIAAVDDQVAGLNQTLHVAVTVSDAETAAADLTVLVTTSDDGLLPAAGVAVSGAGATRTLALTPGLNRAGTGTVVVTVSDGLRTTTASFAVTVRRTVVYVNSTAHGLGNGSSWTDAFKNLTDALAAAQPYEDIWVAQGTYRPSAAGDRTASFALGHDRALIGGFGGTESAADAADPALHPTILSGDIGVAGDASDNSRTVLKVESHTRVQGVTIADATGTELQDGGALAAAGTARVMFVQCVFQNNTAGGGAGLTSYAVGTQLLSCTFRDNHAVAGGSAGGSGAGALLLGSGAVVDGCAFLHNAAAGEGGGLRDSAGDARVTNSRFEDNVANSAAGLSGANALTRCTFVHNTAVDTPAAKLTGAAILESCAVLGNGSAGWAAVYASANVQLQNCVFYGNTSSLAGTSEGRSIATAADLSAVNCTFWCVSDGTGQQAEIVGLGYHNTFLNCIFAEPDSSNLVYYYRGRDVRFDHCLLKYGLAAKLSIAGTLTDSGGNRTGGALFVDTGSPAGPDGQWFTDDDGMQLLVGSPARNAGTASGAAATDCVAQTRPIGTAPDIGAYEFPLGDPVPQVADGTEVDVTIDRSAGPAAGRWQCSVDGGTTWADAMAGAAYADPATTTLRVLQPADAAGTQYRYVLELPSGLLASSSVTLIPTTWTQQPQATALVAGDRCTLTVAATGSPAPTLQWQVSADDGATWVDVADGGPYRGAHTPQLSIGPVSAMLRLQQYRAVASNGMGPAIASAAAVLNVRGLSPVCWGNGASGATAVPPDLVDVIAIAAGYSHTLALKGDGTVVAWGSNAFGQSSVPAGLRDVVAIAAGSVHSVAIRRDGTVVAWGDNQYGECNVPPGLTGVVQVAAGVDTTAALLEDGTVVNWGAGSSSPPAELNNVVAVQCGAGHVVALKADGTVVTWGSYSAPQPGAMTDIVAIADAYFSGVALKRDGTVVTWGDNGAPAGLQDVTAVAAGYQFSLALKRDGSVVGWGQSPYASPPADLAGCVRIAAGGEHAVALQLGAAKRAASVAFGDLNLLYQGGPVQVPVTTVPAGLAVALYFDGSTRVPKDAGSYTVSAVVTDANYIGTASGTLTILPAPLVVQGVNDIQALGGQTPSLSVTYSGFRGTDTAAVLTAAPVASTTATAASASGAYPITVGGGAAKNYNLVYAAGTLQVGQATPAVTWPMLGPIAYGTPLSEAQLCATADVPGSFTYSPAAGTVLQVGAHTLSATFQPQDPTRYFPVTSSQTVQVVAAEPTISWPTPRPITYGTARGATQLNAAVPGIDGTFTYQPDIGAVLGAGDHVLTVTFTPADLVNYRTSTAAVTLSVQRATPAITWPAPDALMAGTVLGAAQLCATADLPGTFTYTPAAGTVLSEGASQVLRATFAPNDATNYATVEVERAITVLPNPMTASHAVVEFGYTPAPTVSIQNSLGPLDGVTSVVWQVVLPTGWSFVSSSGSAADSGPAAGGTDLLEWRWNAAPTAPLAFTYILRGPAIASGKSKSPRLLRSSRAAQRCGCLHAPTR